MTGEVFFWYVLPYLLAAAAFGWLLYDRRHKNNHRMHPGE